MQARASGMVNVTGSGGFYRGHIDPLPGRNKHGQERAFASPLVSAPAERTRAVRLVDETVAGSARASACRGISAGHAINKCRLLAHAAGPRQVVPSNVLGTQQRRRNGD